MTTTTTSTTSKPAVSNKRFAALKAKLRELFELDKSDLDFGIYRIMAAKNKEVTDFLDRQLKDAVRETLADHGSGATAQVEAELEEAIKQAEGLGVDPESTQKVQQLRAKLESAGGASAAELEADIYNHLLTFFSRYYDEGDFISQRRYKGDTYAIPYSGEEVTLHWANKDQYYIKSGEWHKDYRFRIGDKSVRFKLVEATQEGGGGNNKERDDAKRRYIIDEDDPVEVTDAELTIHFHFRPPTEDDKQRAADGAVAIFGGDFSKDKNPKKGDEREQFCALAERIIREALGCDGALNTSEDTSAVRQAKKVSTDWCKLLAAAAPTPGKPERTILGKHLDDFTARNTFDYFIHKDLGGFLRRELDFYIKNEVVRLDDLAELPPDHLQRVQGKVKAIRRVAGRIIDFLAAIENFQKKLWLKKKLVLETNWLITVDRIPGASENTATAAAQGRDSAEETGVRDEETRVGAEETRVRGEETRVRDEETRVRDEESRVRAEETRVRAEETRVRAEETRVRAEETRVRDEETRVSAEETRVARTPTPVSSALSHRSAHDLRDLRAVVANNPRQWQQWEDLGFKPPEDSELLLKGPEWGTREYLDAHENLVVDTALFPPEFKAALLACEEVLGGAETIEDATTGVLVNGDNFGALTLFDRWGSGQIPFIYLDPPYNTERDRLEGKFIYKDGFEHSSWSTLFRDRIDRARDLLKKNDFALMVSLDENELPNAAKHVPFAKLQGFFTWRRTRTGGHLSKSFNQLSDYVLVFTPNGGPGSWLFGGRADPDESQPLTKKTNKISELLFAAQTLEFVDLEEGEISAGTYSDGFIELEEPIKVQNHVNVDEVRIKAPFTWQQSMLQSELARGARMIVKRHKNMNIRFFREAEGHKPLPSLADGEFDVGTNEDASSLLTDLLGYEVPGAYPKPVRLLERLVMTKGAFISDLICLDYFAGTGTTGHAVLNLNRADGQHRQMVLVEVSAYFNTVLKPRIAKVIYSPDWKDGKAQSHDKGHPGGALVKYFALESYEDALNNLPAAAPDGGVLEGLEPAAREAMLTYALDLELGPHLLNLDAFRDPWGFSIHAQLAGEDEIKPHAVDLIETFNYLLGLKVRAYGPIERYSAEFERAAHDEDKDKPDDLPHMGRLKVKGRLRRDPAPGPGSNAPFIFQRIEGELNDRSDTRVLVIWRKLTDDPEQDAAVLDAWMARHREATKERSEYRDYHLIYVNGPVTLPQPTQELRTVFPIEQTFKDRMFEDTDAAPGTSGSGGI